MNPMRKTCQPTNETCRDASLPSMTAVALRCGGDMSMHEARRCLRRERDEACSPSSSPRHVGVLWLSWCRRNDIVAISKALCRRRIRMSGAAVVSIMVCRRRVRLLAWRYSRMHFTAGASDVWAAVFSPGVCRRRIRLSERWQPYRHRAAGEQVIGRRQSRRPCAAGASGISVCLSPSGEGLTNACT